MELYPSENIIKTFLDMVVKQKHLFTPDARNVFVLPIFEVKSNQVAPLNKTTLIEMYHNRTAFKFHEQICNQCHEVPKVFEWLKLPIENNLKPFTFVKRKEKFRIWEPFYIDTNFEPVFEERINWENGEDKMSQNYKQCLLDYNYWVLDNAFLVHRPGIKVFNLKHPDTRKESTKFDKDRLKNEYITLFGNVVGC
ncbi:hypothetical protein FQR65_LT13215 [Abscondita terminalis]|nr:hypothetical protein FQR65_LT13215 [Abscondita terminalis]